MPYEVDNLTDDELFALDLIEKLGEENVTDEELQSAIEQAKANQDLFKTSAGFKGSLQKLRKPARI